MDIVAQKKETNKRYLPHTVSTKEGAVKLYRKTKDIDFVLRRYHILKAFLMRWNKLYDGTKESLVPKSHRPHRQHPNAHTEEELNWIRNYHRRNPNISICELSVSFVKRKPTADIQGHCIVCSSGSAIGRKWNPRRRNPSI